MKDKMLEQRIQQSLNAELSGLNTTSWQRDQYFENATGGTKVKRKLTTSLVLAIVLLLIAATAAAIALLTPEEVVEQVAAPAAKENDPDWKINTEFTAEELENFIRSANEIGIEISEDDPIMEALRNGEGFDEYETIMEFCRQAFGGTYGEWTIAQQHWFSEMMTASGYPDWEPGPMPGPDDLTEEEARAKLIQALRDEFCDEMYQSDYDDGLDLTDRSLFGVQLTFNAEAQADGTVWHMWAYPRDEERYEWYTAALDREGNVLSTLCINRRESVEDTRPEPTREEADMVHAAAEGIREKSKKDSPLEDPEKFRYTTWMEKEGENIVWHIDFISKTMDWGFCSATVNEATGKVRVLEADTGTITADNIFERFRAAYDYENDWTTETWGALGAAAPLLSAETTEGRIVKATPWIAWREGLLTPAQAEEQAFRKTSTKIGEINTMCLIDAEPNPVWKLRLMEWSGDYRDMLIELDAVTGEMVDLDLYMTQNPDEPYYHVYTRHKTWASIVLQEEGPLYLAQLAVLHTFADLSYDLPQVDSIPIFDENFWTPEIDGNTVTFRCHWSNLPDYRVTLDENGLPAEAGELPSSGTEELPPEKMPGADDLF